jgi:hypothetical protein
MACETCRYWKDPQNANAFKLGYRACTRIHDMQDVEDSIPAALRNARTNSEVDRQRYWDGAQQTFATAQAVVSGDKHCKLLTHKSFGCNLYIMG